MFFSELLFFALTNASRLPISWLMVLLANNYLLKG
jgi:hypothetical protein